MLPRLFAAAALASSAFLAHGQAADPNLQNLLAGLMNGAAVTLITPLTTGQIQVTSFRSLASMNAADAVAYVDRARQQLALLGFQQPTAEEIARMLAGGPLEAPAGRVTVPGILNVAGVSASISSQIVAAGTPVPGYGTFGANSAAGGSAPALTAPAREQAIQQLATLGILNPSEDQIRTALVGGTITTVNGIYQLPGVLPR
jgi:hypothetical protein